MVINYPTGLYKVANSYGFDNVTWHISNNAPSRSNEYIIKVPVAEGIKQLGQNNYNRKDRRRAFGELLYIINEASHKAASSSKKTYAEGDVLDFSSQNQESLSIPKSNKIESRLDLNRIDFDSLGLNEEEIDDFYIALSDKRDELESEFLKIRSEINDIESDISETQKKLNESNKALNAATIIGDDDLITIISGKKDNFNNIISELSELYELKVAELDEISNKINEVDMVMK